MTETSVRLERAVLAAQEVLFRKQRPDGAWLAGSDMGPVCTAQVLVTLRLAGALPDDDARDGARFLLSRQRDDGSWQAYPFAREGSAGATACAWAALRCCGLADSHPAVTRARDFVEQHGGVAALRGGLLAGDLSLFFLALAGAVPASLLPRLPLAWCLARPVTAWLETHLHGGVPLVALQLAVIARRLQGAWGPDGLRRGRLDQRCAARTVAATAQWQNRDGSINANSVQTALALCAWHACGLTRGDARVDGAIASLQAARRRGPDGLWWFAFEADVWTTALNARALLASGLAASDARLARAVDYLLACQSDVPQPAVNQRRRGAPRTGGWAFQRDNLTMVDCDDTGMVLGVLGAFLERGPAPEQAVRVREAVRRGRAWLLGMQNPDGGWAAFVWNLPPRRPGAPMTRATAAPRGLAAAWRFLRDPPPELGDPSTEDVTARVLYGLARTGDRAQAAPAARGLAFLERFQEAHGGFWGRWVCNYLPATAYVLGAAAALGAGPQTPWVSRALAFVTSRQNADGGFGEWVDSYRDPARAGRGESTAPLTGLVLTALVDHGLHASSAARAAAGFLLSAQRADGTFSSQDYLATFVPPESFYDYPGTADYAPLEALGRLRACAPGAVTGPTPR